MHRLLESVLNLNSGLKIDIELIHD